MSNRLIHSLSDFWGGASKPHALLVCLLELSQSTLCAWQEGSCEEGPSAEAEEEAVTCLVEEQQGCAGVSPPENLWDIFSSHCGAKLLVAFICVVPVRAELNTHWSRLMSYQMSRLSVSVVLGTFCLISFGFSFPGSSLSCQSHAK